MSAAQGPVGPGPIGLLGGSFDPVHAGHLALARAAESALGLRQLLFLPAGQPWQKPPLSPAPQRRDMLALALGGHPGWQMDTRELERPGATYTVDTLREIRAAAGPDIALVWILGSDQLRQLSSWHAWERLLDLAHLAYAQRPGAAEPLPPPLQAYVRQHQGTPADLQYRPAGRLIEFAMTPVDCSSSRIRGELGAGVDTLARRFLPAPVLDYVRSHSLYMAAHGQ